MIKTSLFKHTFALLFLIGVLNFIGNKLYLSWTVWWFDVFLHFFSGACVGMATILAWNYFSGTPVTDKLKMIFIAFIGTLTIGLLWEIFELYFGITFLADGIFYIRDTVSDLLMDMSGGFFGVLYAYRILSKENDNL